jgi:hypothetical protein
MTTEERTYNGWTNYAGLADVDWREIADSIASES